MGRGAVRGGIFFFFKAPATTGIYTLSLHDALPISGKRAGMFGLFALSGRVTAFAGPALVAWVTLAFDSQRAGMASTLVFLVLGLGLLIGLRAPESMMR